MNINSIFKNVELAYIDTFDANYGEDQDDINEHQEKGSKKNEGEAHLVVLTTVILLKVHGLKID